MDEEIFLAFFWGVMFAMPIGWFLRSAMQWKRDARASAPPAPPPPPPVASAPDSRVEKLLERISQRMETLEDRIEFTERLLDARSQMRRSEIESPVAALHDPATPR